LEAKYLSDHPRRYDLYVLDLDHFCLYVVAHCYL